MTECDWPDDFNVVLGGGEYGVVFGSNKNMNTAVKAIYGPSRLCKYAEKEFNVQRRIRNAYESYGWRKSTYVPKPFGFCNNPKHGKYTCFYSMERVHVNYIYPEIKEMVKKRGGSENLLVHFIPDVVSFQKTFGSTDSLNGVHVSTRGTQTGFYLHIEKAEEIFTKHKNRRFVIETIDAIGVLHAVIIFGAGYDTFDTEFVYIKDPGRKWPFRIAVLDFGLVKHFGESYYKEIGVKPIDHLNRFSYKTAMKIYDDIIDDHYTPTRLRKTTIYYLNFVNEFLKTANKILISKKKSGKTRLQGEAKVFRPIMVILYALFIKRISGNIALKIMEKIIPEYYRVLNNVDEVDKIERMKKLRRLVRARPNVREELFDKVFTLDTGNLKNVLDLGRNAKPEVKIWPERYDLAGVLTDIYKKGDLRRGNHLREFLRLDMHKRGNDINEDINRRINITVSGILNNVVGFVNARITPIMNKYIGSKKRWFPLWWPKFGASIISKMSSEYPNLTPKLRKNIMKFIK